MDDVETDLGKAKVWKHEYSCNQCGKAWAFVAPGYVPRGSERFCPECGATGVCTGEAKTGETAEKAGFLS